MSRTVAHSVGWAAAGRIGQQGVQFASGLVLARLLSPADYGVIASALVITGFSLLFFEMGLAPALVQLRNLTDEDLCTAFWINALGGLVFAALLAAAAPLVASFFSQDALNYVVPVIALGFTANLGICHFALMQRGFRFRALAIIEVCSMLAGVTVSIALAAAGVGVLSLAVGPVVQSTVASVALWRAVPWRPQRKFSRAALSRLWSFSGGQLGFNVVWYWGRNADNLMIGRLLGAASLGLYNRAYTLMMMPITQVSSVVGRVMFPALSVMQDNPERAALAYRRALLTINTVTTPVLVLMVATAPALVPVLWGGAWDDAVPLLQILGAAGIPQCMTASTGWILRSQGHTGTLFRLALANTPVTVGAMFIGLKLGDAEGVALGLLTAMWVLLLPTLYFACRIIGLTARRVLLDNTLTIVTAAGTGAVVWFLPVLLSLEHDTHWLLPPQILLGVSVYLAAVRLLQRSTWDDVRDLLRHRRTNVGMPSN